MAERPTYICIHCGSRFPGPPAGTVRRPSGTLGPVCPDGLLALIPDRYELERRWLAEHTTS